MVKLLAAFATLAVSASLPVDAETDAAADQLPTAQFKSHRQLREGQYHELREAVRAAKIMDASALSAWLPRQPFPEDFKREVRERITIATTAMELAWGDVGKLSDEVLLRDGLEDHSPIKDLIIALRRTGRTTDAKALARRFAYRAEDDDDEQREKERKSTKLLKDLEWAIPGAKRFPARGDGESEALRIMEAVRRFCEAGDREAAERVVQRLSKREKPVDKYVRRYHRELYRRTGDLQGRQGDVKAALATHRLADEILEPGEWEFQPLTRLAWSLRTEFGLDGALNRARQVSLALEQAVLQTSPPAGPDRANEVRRAEEAYWRLLPRIAKEREVGISAVSFANDYVRQGDFAAAERVLERALTTKPLRLEPFSAHLFEKERLWRNPAAVDKLSKLLLELVEADVELTAEQKANVKLDVAVAKSKIGREIEARRLAADAKRDIKKADERFELVELLSGSPEPALSKLDSWMKDFGTPIEEVMRWDPPEDFLRELVQRIEKLETSEEGLSETTKNQVIALVSCKLGDIRRTKTAIEAIFRSEPQFAWRIVEECDLFEFGWDLIRGMPFKSNFAGRAAAAAELASDLLGLRLGIE
jgi:hypothetical protein